MTLCTRAAVADHPTSADLVVHRALAAFLSGELMLANAYTLNALRLDPDNYPAKALRKRIKAVEQLRTEGSAFAEQEMWTNAIEKYSEALQV